MFNLLSQFWQNCLATNITQLNSNCNTHQNYFAVQLTTTIFSRMVIVLDVNERIRQLLDKRGWTEYRLAKEAKLSQSTIANLFNRNTTPSVSTLEAICSGFGITLSQFFADGNWVELTDEQVAFFDEWTSLTADEKELIRQIVRKFKGGH